MTRKTKCVHHWLVPNAAKEMAAVCRDCGCMKTFVNDIQPADWHPRGPKDPVEPGQMGKSGAAVFGYNRYARGPQN